MRRSKSLRKASREFPRRIAKMGSWNSGTMWCWWTRWRMDSWCSTWETKSMALMRPMPAPPPPTWLDLAADPSAPLRRSILKRETTQSDMVSKYASSPTLTFCISLSTCTLASARHRFSPGSPEIRRFVSTPRKSTIQSGELCLRMAMDLPWLEPQCKLILNWS